MFKKTHILYLGLLPLVAAGAQSWSIRTAADWVGSIQSSQGVTIVDGVASPTGESGTLRTKLKAYKQKRSAKSLTLGQSPLWQNWEPRPRIAPRNLRDAPVFLAKGPDDYWMFGRYGGFGNNRGKPFEPEDAERFWKVEPPMSYPSK